MFELVGKSPLPYQADEKVILAPNWIFLAIAWIALAFALSNRKYPLRVEIPLVIIFLAFTYIVFDPTILSFIEKTNLK